MILASFLALSIGLSQDPLTRYVFDHDTTTRWTQSPTKGSPKSINLVSQTWHGVKWKHEITFNHPTKLINKGTAVLVITGDRTGMNDEAFASKLAGIAGMPVATLYQIPNQPIWDQKEDGLIAVTLQKWFETKDDSWPLLFPMAKAAYEAMNTIEKSTASTKNPIKKFVITGASKRGWTTWLVAGTGDKRIIGLAPVVFDNLNIVVQMKHQKELWGHYSPQIQDYEKSGMLAALETPDGKRLAAMLDPLTYADRIKCPLFSINGTNDPFWAPDAMSLYWDKLKMPKSCLFLPNEGHTFQDEKPYIWSLGAFASSCAGEFAWPSVELRVVDWKENRLRASFVQYFDSKRYLVVKHPTKRRLSYISLPASNVQELLGSNQTTIAIAKARNFNCSGSTWSPLQSVGMSGGPLEWQHHGYNANCNWGGPIGAVILVPFRSVRGGFWLSSRISLFEAQEPTLGKS